MTLGRHKYNRMADRSVVIVMVAILVCAFPFTIAWSAEGDCLSSAGETAVAACRRELLRDPGNVDIRFALSDAYMGLRRYAEAVAVLRDGLERFPGDDEIKKRMILSESYLKEQQYIEKQKESTAAASRSRKEDTRIRLSIIRCKKLKGDAAMAACNEGLAVAPDNSDLLTGRGNAWLAMDRYGNAISDFEAALAADPKNRDATKNLRLARTKRNVKVAQCLQADGLDGLKACDAALLQGASDEFSIQKRRARLLHTMGREKEAIKAYRVAADLNPADGQIRQSLAALSPQGESPEIQEAPAPSPTAGKSIIASTVKPLPPPKKKPRTKPVSPAPPSIKAVASAPEPPAQPSPAKAFDPPEVKNPVPAPIKDSPPMEMAAMQPRRYSNAPEVPGITH